MQSRGLRSAVIVGCSWVVGVSAEPPRLVFPTRAEHVPGALDRLRSIDVASASDGSGRLAIFADTQIYGGPGDNIALIRNVPFSAPVPTLGNVNHYLMRSWALSDGRIAASPNEVMVLSHFGADTFTPLAWGRGPIAGTNATIAWGDLLRVDRSLSVSRNGDITAALSAVGMVAGRTNPYIVYRVGELQGRSRVLLVSGADPLNRPNRQYRFDNQPFLGATSDAGVSIVQGDLWVNNEPSNRGWLWADSTGASGVLIDRDTPLPPPMNAMRFQQSYSPGFINAAGDCAFHSMFVGAGPTSAILRWKHGQLEVLCPANHLFPQFGEGVRGSVFQFGASGFITPSGDVVASVQLSGPGITSANNYVFGLFDREARFHPIFRKGEAIPGFPAGASIFDHSPNRDYLYANARGQLIFRANVGASPALFSWSKAVGLRLLLGAETHLEYQGATRRLTQLPTVNEVLYSNYWLNSSNGQDGRMTLLAESGVAYIPVQFSSTEWAIYAVDVPDPCPIDTNADGFVDFFDYDVFVDRFQAGDPLADFNADGMVDGFDYGDFVTAFEGGC